MIPHELLLLAWRELDHPELCVRMKRREDPIVDAEIGVAHVSAFACAHQSQGNAAKVIRRHSVSVLTLNAERVATTTDALQDPAHCTRACHRAD